MGHLRDVGFSTGEFCGGSESNGKRHGDFITDFFISCSAPDRGIFVPFKKVVMAWNQ